MKAKEFINKLNLSTFKGTICISEKELERHLEEFGKRSMIDVLRWYEIDTPISHNEYYQEMVDAFLEDQE